MSLIEIKQYLMQVKMASLSSLCAYFNCEADLLRSMLTHWIRKGVVCRFTPESSACRSCMKCTPKTLEVYQWVG